MKDLVTAIGSLFILMVFVMQFSANQSLAAKAVLSDAECRKEVSYLDAKGGSTEEYADGIKMRMAAIWQCDKDDIKVSISRDMDEGKPSYAVSVPVRGFIACGELLGIPDDENIWIYETAGNIE